MVGTVAASRRAVPLKVTAVATAGTRAVMPWRKVTGGMSSAVKVVSP